MTYYAVAMHHPDGDGWGQHVGAHVSYLEGLIVAGKLKASGPIKGDRLRGGLLIFHVADRDEVLRLVESDPFSKAGLIESISVTEWDPIFGAFRAESSAATSPANSATIR